MKILVTGSSGQLAKALQIALDGQGTTLALGRHALNLALPDQVRHQVRLLQPDLIVNAAAYTAVDRAQTEPEQAFLINATAPGVLAEEAARLGIPLIHYSTDYVFDGRKPEPYREDDPTHPLSVYGESKLAGEQAVQKVAGEHLILRTSWVYSLHGHNFLLTMQRLMQERDVLSIVDDEIGAPTWASTIATVTADIIRQWRAGHGSLSGLYHLSTTGETSWYGFACSIAEYLRQQGRLRARLEPIAADDYHTAAQRPSNSRLDCTRLQQQWNIQLPHWQTALNECLSLQSSPPVTSSGQPLSRRADGASTGMTSVAP